MTNESDALIARLRIQAVVYHHEGMQDEQVLSDAAADRIAALTAELAQAREEAQQLRERKAMVSDALRAATERADAYERDARRLATFERWADEGAAPALVFDDDGHWQVTFEGTQPIPRGDGKGYDQSATICSFTDADKWHTTVAAAIDAALAQEPAP